MASFACVYAISVAICVVILSVGFHPAATTLATSARTTWTVPGWRGEQCDALTHVRVDETVRIHNFLPAQQRSYYGTHFYQPGRPPYGYRPRECTWHFKTNESCTLEFHRTQYERGDIDCNEQYLLLGDEKYEKRICGFAKLPRHFNSSGSELFLTYYQRNSHGWTAGSQVGGFIHCREKACPMQTQFDAGNIQDTCGHLGQCVLIANVTAGVLKLPVTTTCDPPPGEICTIVLNFFVAHQPLNQTCQGPLPPLPDTPGSDKCVSGSLQCPKEDPNCLVGFIFSFGGRRTGEALPCNAPLGTLCTFRILFCVFSNPTSDIDNGKQGLPLLESHDFVSD